MSSATLDRVHHLVLALLSVIAVIALYRFATLLLAGLPWHQLPIVP